MNAQDLDASMRKTAPFVPGTAKNTSRWREKVLPGGKRALWVLVGLALVVLLVWAIRPSSPTQHTRHGFRSASGTVPVGVARAALSDVRVTLDALGAVTPIATVTVKPEVTGIIDKINFQEGQMVKAGDVLVQIDPRPYQAALDQAKGALARDQASLANAKIDLGRYQALYAQNAISQQTLATQEALVRTDEGTVKADVGAVEAAAVNLVYCTITSPVPGRVGLRQVDLGNLVQPGVTTAIVIVTELQPMSVLFSLPEDDVEQITQQVHAGRTLAVEAYDRTQSTELASGTLETMDNEVNSTTGTVELRAMFDNKDNHLFPQQFVNIRLLVRVLPDQTTVPTAAIQRGAEGNFVYVVNRDRTVSVRNVVLGPTDNDKVDVTSGLRPGEVVVVDGADRLKDGAAVSIPGRLTLGGGYGRGAHWHHHHHGSWQPSGDSSNEAP
jgi:membrane fusion protein, multidrug efflux system